MTRPPPPTLRVRILLWRLRRVGVLAGVLLAVTFVARTLAPPPPVTEPVVVVARDVPAGAVLRSADLRVVHLPARGLPEAVYRDEADLLGRGVAVDLPRGLPVVDGLLEGSRFGLDPPAGTVVVPVHLAGAAGGGLLQPGDRIDLVAPADVGWVGEPCDQPAPTVLATGALVVSVGAEADGAASLLGGPAPSGSAADVTLVAVSTEEGHRLASMSGISQMGAVLVR